MKKAKKGLLLSLFTLIAAVAITATSTYAWFVVNRSVEATNMQLTLRSDTTYLVISSTDPGEGGVASLGTGTSAEATASEAQVLPVMYDTTGSDPTAPATRWKYASGTNYTTGTANGGYTTVSQTQVSDYTVHYVFYVGLTPTSATAQQNLKVTGLTVGASSSVFRPAVSVVLKCGSTVIDFEDITSTATQQSLGGNGSILSSTVALDTVYTIEAWVYVNGDNTAVTSANATEANLGSFTVSMTLGIDTPQA